MRAFLVESPWLASLMTEAQRDGQAKNRSCTWLTRVMGPTGFELSPVKTSGLRLACVALTLAIVGCSRVAELPLELHPGDSWEHGRASVVGQETVPAKEMFSQGIPSEAFLVAQAQSPGADVADSIDDAEFDGSESADSPDAAAEEDEFYDPFAAPGAEGGEIEEYDPLEPYNVLVFKFNYNLDKYFVRPVAEGYDFVVPNAVQRGIFNVFNNIRFVPRLLNNVFQGKFKGAGLEGSRFIINSTLGIGGLFDPAEEWFDLDTPPEDFGQTLGVYGVGPGPYLLLPLWPTPLTVRDGFGLVVDLFLDPFNWLVLPLFRIDGVPVLAQDEDTAFLANIAFRLVDTLNTRSLNLETFQGVEAATVDLYSAVRNGYLQSRAHAIQE